MLFCGAIITDADNLPQTRPEKVGLSSDRLANIDRTVQSWVDDGRISGAVSLVARHGKVAKVTAYGMQDIESATPMPEDAIFRIMSMTKPITSLAVLMLYEEGRFLLTDPIAKYIPAFENMRVIVPGYEGVEDPPTMPAKRPITIRHLLLHTAGLSYGSGAHAPHYKKARITEMRGPEHTDRELVLALAEMPLLFHPGDDYRYSLSDDVLGYFIEVITGMPFDQFLAQRIFEPLGMKDTFFYVPENKMNRLASFYRSTDKGLEKLSPTKKETAPASQQRHLGGGGGLYSTAGDYARFCQMLLNGGEYDGIRLVSRKTVEMLSANGLGDIDPKLPEGGDKWGLGGVSVRTKYFTDAGLLSPGCYMKTGAFSTFFVIDPSEDMFSVFMTQLQPLNVEMIHYMMVLGTQAVAD